MKAKTKCSTPYCRNPRAHWKTKCHKCVERAKRRANPLRAAWRNVKNRAKRKRLEFAITFEQFKELAAVFGYNKGSGLHLDRKEAHKGYTLGNLQFLEASENIAKGNRERHLPEYVQAMLKRKQVSDEPDPF